MRRILTLIFTLLAALSLSACTAASSEQLTGSAEGYGGTLSVAVTTTDGKISDVKVTQHSETEGVGTRAIDALPAQMISAGTWEVDNVSGATVTSTALKSAVASAMGATSGTSQGTGSGNQGGSSQQSQQSQQSEQPQLSGIGMAANGRIGPGQDDQGNPVYSFNVVFAAAKFDPQGRITSIAVDQLEVATPNYDGASMPHFSGFPGQGGYARWDDAEGKVSGKTSDTEENFLSEVASWTSKRARGENYPLGHGTWSSQMDAYEQMMTGKTVDEIESWFFKYFSPTTGRPLHSDSDNEEEQQLWEALTDQEKSELADITSGATMSLRDPHGDILLAVRRAWENAQKTE